MAKSDFKKCTWKASPSDDCEYSPLNTSSKFVTLETKKRTVRELAPKKKPKGTEPGYLAEKGYRDIDHVKELLHVKYPDYDVNTDTILAREREQYWLVVNHTTKSAKAVLKSIFPKFYSEGQSFQKKVKGDSGVDPHTGKQHKERIKKHKAKQKDIEKRHKKA